MSSTKKLTDAKTTCDGLHRLVRRLNVAADDLDKQGVSAYELIALLASTHSCVSSLSTQLEELEDDVQTADSVSPESTKDTVTLLRRVNGAKEQLDDNQEPALTEKSFIAQG